MKTFYTHRESNSIADVSQYSNNHYMIHRINVPKKFRGNKIGSSLLDQICNDADNERVHLILMINSTGDLDEWQLQAWYESRGFREMEAGFFIRHAKNTYKENVGKTDDSIVIERMKML